jgi:hypothetical protein
MTLLEELQDAVIKPADYQTPVEPQRTPLVKLTLGHWLLALLALLCVLFIAFITLARSVQITS